MIQAWFDKTDGSFKMRTTYGSKPILSIKNDGSIEVGEGYKMDEAGSALIIALQKLGVRIWVTRPLHEYWTIDMIPYGGGGSKSKTFETKEEAWMEYRLLCEDPWMSLVSLSHTEVLARQKRNDDL